MSWKHKNKHGDSVRSAYGRIAGFYQDESDISSEEEFTYR